LGFPAGKELRDRFTLTRPQILIYNGRCRMVVVKAAAAFCRLLLSP